MAKVKREYNAHATLSKFHNSPAFHRGIRGPRGSGKSTGCCIEVFKRATEQAPSPDGLRHTRWAIVRNTYRELLDTTVKTWMYWFEAVPGDFNQQNMTHAVQYKDMRAEFLFRALDRPGDIKKTLSLELTGAYINEAKEIPFGIISGLDDAIGRYPAKDIPNGFHGPSWSGMLLDTNSPDEDHWWYRLDEQYRNGDLDPAIWQFFTQPGGLVEKNGVFHANPKAENLENIGEDYYLKRMVGKSKDHIRVYYCNQYGFVLEGKPVHPEYVDAVHCPEEVLKAVKGLPIYVGIDFGLTPAAVFGQILPNGRWQVINEIVTERMGITSFAHELKQFIAQNYQGFEFVIKGDPAGVQESQTDETTPFQILASNGIPAEPAIVLGSAPNEPTLRREALQQPLTRMIDGKPGMLVSPVCKVLRKALAGGYCYKRKQIAGDERYQDKPDKNRYSHVAEACEYMAIGGGEGSVLIKTVPPAIEEEDFDFKYNVNIDMGAMDHGGYGQGWMR